MFASVTTPAPTQAPSTGMERAESLCGAAGVLGQSVDVTSQEALDALAGCERIMGSLTLHAFTGMDVAPLQALHTVDGTVTVYGGLAPNERVLDGLARLQQVGGLHLYGLSAPSLEPLAQLRSIGAPAPGALLSEPLARSETPGDLSISSFPQLSSLSGLAALETVSAIVLIENASFSSLAGLSGAPRLERLVVQSCPLSSLSGVEALKVGDLSVSFSALTSLSGLGDATQLSRLLLSNNAQLDSLEGGSLPAQMVEVHLIANPLASLHGLEGLREVGTLAVSGGSGPGLSSLDGLGGLERASLLVIEQQPQLSNLSGLGSLVHVEDFQLNDNAALATLAGLTSLREVGGLSVTAAPGLTSFAGIGSVTMERASLVDVGARSLAGLEGVSLVASLSIERPEQLVSLDGLPQLAAGAALHISDAPALSDVGALAALDALGELSLTNTGARDLDALAGLRQLERLDLQGNAQLVQIDGVGAVAGLVTLSVLDNPTLRSLPSFANVEQGSCTDCLFNLQVIDNALLKTGPALPKLQGAGAVYVQNNPSLSTLPGLAALRSVYTLEVSDNASLVTLALPSLQQANQILIRGNGALDDASLAPLRALPAAQRVKIASNKSGPSLFQPCPWAGDNVCDESLGDCAPGSDLSDCTSGF
jgi:Leucine-rich repeat (LRR) protein